MTRGSLAAVGLAICLAWALAACGSSSSTGSTTVASPATTNQTAPTGTNDNTTGAEGDNSIQTYGSEAAGSEKTEVATAAHAFFAALAAPHYAGVCAGLTSSNRVQLGAFRRKNQQGSCTVALKMLLPHSQAAEARQAAAAPVSAVRIKGDTAFVLFTPKGGQPSFFVMKQEGGAWKAIALSAGTPLEPSLPTHVGG